MVSQGHGNVVNVTTIGVTTLIPRFSAYIASKSALDAFSQVVNSEMVSNHVTITSVRMPLVRTPMIAPTKAYDYFPAITPEEAADLIIEGIADRKRTVDTSVGNLSQFLHATTPRLADRVKHIGSACSPIPRRRWVPRRTIRTSRRAPSSSAWWRRCCAASTCSGSRQAEVAGAAAPVAA